MILYLCRAVAAVVGCARMSQSPSGACANWSQSGANTTNGEKHTTATRPETLGYNNNRPLIDTAGRGKNTEQTGIAPESMGNL